MEHVQDIAVKIITPLFYPVAPGQRIFVVYLGTAMILALGVYFATPRPAAAAVVGFLRYCFPKSVYFHKSAQVDYLYFIVNKCLVGVFLAPLLLGAGALSNQIQAALTLIAGVPEPQSAGAGIAALFTMLALIAFDLGIFIAHYLQHKVPLLWEFHKVHHSAEVMTPITVYRMHPVDDLLSGTIVGLLTGVVYGGFAYAYGDTAQVFTVYHLNVGLILFYLAGYNLRHSHIWLAYPRWLSHILVSPAQHQIHHSAEPRHFDKNIGFMFAFWDWIAGTLYVQKGREEFSLGLHGGEHRMFDSVLKLYVLPFQNAARLLGGARRDKRA